MVVIAGAAKNDSSPPETMNVRAQSTGKVPVLIDDDAPPLFDFCVVCEYLEDLGNGAKRIPSEHSARFRTMADGPGNRHGDAGIAARLAALCPMSAGEVSADGYSFSAMGENSVAARFSRRIGVGTTFAISSLKASFLIRWRAAMNLNRETMLLQSLFGACVLICTMTLGSMLLM